MMNPTMDGLAFLLRFRTDAGVHRPAGLMVKVGNSCRERLHRNDMNLRFIDHHLKRIGFRSPSGWMDRAAGAVRIPKKGRAATIAWS